MPYIVGVNEACHHDPNLLSQSTILNPISQRNRMRLGPERVIKLDAVFLHGFRTILPLMAFGVTIPALSESEALRIILVIILYDIILCYVMLCYIILYDIILYYPIL